MEGLLRRVRRDGPPPPKPNPMPVGLHWREPSSAARGSGSELWAEMVRYHEIDRLPAEETNALDLPGVREHLGEPQEVRGSRHQAMPSEGDGVRVPEGTLAGRLQELATVVSPHLARATNSEQDNQEQIEKNPEADSLPLEPHEYPSDPFHSEHSIPVHGGRYQEHSPQSVLNAELGEAEQDLYGESCRRIGNDLRPHQVPPFP